jgi:O-phosphoseryl-tRNA(Sec) kinase
MDQFLLALCGLPASGKTLLSRTVAQMMDQGTVHIVSTDEWRDTEYYRAFNPENEQRVRRLAIERTGSLLQQGFSVIHDDTNYYASMRHELFVLAEGRACRFGIVHVSTPLRIALRWNAERSDSVPEEVVRRISERLDVPGQRYAWDRPIAQIDLSITDLRTAASVIVDAVSSLETLGEQPEHEYTGAATEIDRKTREVVSEFLAAHPSYSRDPRVHALRKQAVRFSLDKGLSAEEAADRLSSELEGLID